MDESPKIEEKDVRFVADARLISVLGEQLIGSEKVGVLELVKNAYDAGARNCTVTLEGVPGLEPTRRTLKDYESLQGPIITIVDDGSGMSEDGLVNGWLRPATSKRARVKERLQQERRAANERGSRAEYDALVDELKRAHGNRLPLGEKGIGRLATHRLGSHLWLRTKTSGDPFEWELKIDWADFDGQGNKPQDLSDVQLKLRHQSPTVNYGTHGCGTVICCYGGREGYGWSRDQIIDVGRAVNALRSPTHAPEGFAAVFVSPHVPEHELASPLARAPAPFEIVGIVDDEGGADLEFKYTPPAPDILPNAPAAVSFPTKLDLRKSNSEYWAKNKDQQSSKQPAQVGTETKKDVLRRPECGPFIIHVRSYLRFREWIGGELYDEVTAYLNKWGGITIYRDGLATVPAQQSARLDWLDLAQSQIKRSANISYYHLNGEIELAQEKNLALRDRSSREGMIETQAYRDLAELTKVVVNELQLQMQAIRAAWKKTTKDRIAPRTLRAHAKVAAALSRAVLERYDFKKDALKLSENTGGDKAPEMIASAVDTLDEIGDQLDLLDDEREGLLEVAGFGIAISVAVHEVSKIAGAIVSDTKRLDEYVQQGSAAARIANTLQTRADSLLGEARRIAPLRILRGEPARLFSVRSAIEAAKNAFVFSLKEAQIMLHVDREDFQVRARFGQLAQVFANLIDNALYWVGTGGGVIQFTISPSERTVLISDSGPGISPTMVDNLFKPFYSQKIPPSGLGLYICRHYLAQCKGAIRLARSGERSSLVGAQFLVDFSKTPAE
jgi:signal transduction histidine kinase